MVFRATNQDFCSKLVASRQNNGKLGPNNSGTSDSAELAAGQYIAGNYANVPGPVFTLNNGFVVSTIPGLSFGDFDK